MVDDWLKKLWSIYTMEYYSTIRRDEILPFATTWMDLEIIVLSEISQTEKVENHMILLICAIQTKKQQMNRTNKQRLMDMDNGLVVTRRAVSYTHLTLPTIA